MNWDAKTKKQFALVIAVMTGLLLLGLLSGIGITLTTPAIGIVNPSLVIALSSFYVAYMHYKREI